ncbi:hypothetical protein BDD12DRAFT_983946 [Trichophaea hybrida]|nr:hypothetical protein BDD12DRAFT_983946 [Trichophaea hybrida]
MSILGCHKQVAKLLLQRYGYGTGKDREAIVVLETLLDFQLEDKLRPDHQDTAFDLLVEGETPFDTNFITEAAGRGLFPLTRKLLVMHGTFSPPNSRTTDEIRRLEILTELLEVHLDNIAIDDLSWLKDLNDAGVCINELAQLFAWTPSSEIEINSDSSDRTMAESISTNVQLQHYDACAHSLPDIASQIPTGCRKPHSFENTQEEKDRVFFHDPTALYDKHAELQDAVRGMFQTDWEIRGEAMSISYIMAQPLRSEESEEKSLQPMISKLQNTVDLILSGVRMCNEAEFCCDSFTILVKSKNRPGVIKLRHISSETLLQLSGHLKHWHSNEVIPLAPSQLLATVQLGLAELHSLRDFETHSNTQDVWEFIEYVALLLQMYSLGLVTYTGSHSQSLSCTHSYTNVESVSLHGFTNTGEQSPKITATRLALGCFGEMIGSPVWVFQSGDQAISRKPHYLAATVIDLIDTWGRGYTKSHPNDSNAIVSVRIGGGILKPLTSGDARYDDLSLGGYIPCHWERCHPSQNLQSAHDVTFSAFDILCIGTFAENPDCQFRDNTYDALGPFVEDIAVSNSRWQSENRQLGLAAGQFITLNAVGTQKRVDGVTLKEAISDKWKSKKDLSILTSPWGLEFSLCTGVARRVMLKDLFEGLVIEYAKNKIPREWERLEHCFWSIFHATAEQFSKGVRYLAETNEKDYNGLWEFCNIAFDILILTGVPSHANFIKIWWPCNNETFGFKINEGWPQLLKDATDRATFAVATPKCLTIDTSIACRSQSWQWDYDIRHLQTAVEMDMTTSTRMYPITRDNGMNSAVVNGKRYGLGDGFVVFSTDGVNSPDFSARWKCWPPLTPEFARRKLLRGYIREIISAYHTSRSAVVVISLKN